MHIWVTESARRTCAARTLYVLEMRTRTHQPNKWERVVVCDGVIYMHEHTAAGAQQLSQVRVRRVFKDSTHARTRMQVYIHTLSKHLRVIAVCWLLVFLGSGLLAHSCPTRTRAYMRSTFPQCMHAGSGIWSLSLHADVCLYTLFHVFGVYGYACRELLGMVIPVNR